MADHAKKNKDIFRQSIASYYCQEVSSVEKYFVKTKNGLIFCNILAVLIRSSGWMATSQSIEKDGNSYPPYSPYTLVL